MSPRHIVKARSLQEWMERTGTSGTRLLAMVREQTGHSISPTMLSFILRKSKRCSVVNAVALAAVTGIDSKTLRRWTPSTESGKVSGEGAKHVA